VLAVVVTGGCADMPPYTASAAPGVSEHGVTELVLRLEPGG